MKSIRSNILWSIALGLVGALMALLGYSETLRVCGQCGAFASETRWHMPGVASRGLNCGTRIQPTAVSTALSSLGLPAASHAHDWVLVHTVGSRGCGLGAGSSLYVTMRSQPVGRLIQAADAAGELEFRDELISQCFRRQTSSNVGYLAESAPAGAFVNSAAFRAWRQESMAQIERLLRGRGK